MSRPSARTATTSSISPAARHGATGGGGAATRHDVPGGDGATAASRTSPRRRALAVRAVAVATFASLGLGLAATPALAHDTLVESDPADGATLTEAPEEAVLTFSADLTSSGAVAVLQGPGGEEIELEEPEYDGRDAVWELPEVEAGEQVLVWSVISSDGHRIEGELPFTVETSGDGAADGDGADDDAADDADDTDGAAGSSDDDAGEDGADDDADDAQDTGSAPAAAADGSGETTSDDAGADDDTSDDSSDDAGDGSDEAGSDEDSWLPGSRNAWIIGGLALVVAVAAAVWFFAVRNRGKETDAKDRRDESDDQVF
ncbi:copper resistance CopC family protein [Georgenia sp. Z1344]|uniref:copper resistance CopC family protein n=1 Tax=Georgenia sp. Z1344 TaxID=3416706 RepID=UPI003CECA40C